MSEIKKKVLFVCLGNSCRSPIAEGVFQKTVNKMAQGHLWEIDSAGIADWNVGRSPTGRAQQTMKNHDIPYHNVGRHITEEDFNYYDYIFGMDMSNIKDLRELAPEGSTAKIFLLGDFDPEGEKIIRDPYFDNHARGFEKCYEQAVRCCKGFLECFEKGMINSVIEICTITLYDGNIGDERNIRGVWQRTSSELPLELLLEILSVPITESYYRKFYVRK